MHRIRLVLLGFLLLALTLGLRFNFPMGIFGGINRKLMGDPVSADKSPRSGSILWSADMETGDLSQWSLPDVPGGPNVGGGVFDSGISTATADAVFPAHSAAHSAKLFINTLHPPGDPASGARLFRWLEPQTHPELYYSVWYNFPRRYTPTGKPSWWNLFQWKSKRGGASDPFFDLGVGNRPDGSMYFYLYSPNSKASYSQAIKNIPDGQWFRVEALYKCAGDKTGRVTFWQDGAEILDATNVQTRYPDGDCQWSVNNYSASLDPPEATVYVDDAAICAGGRCP